MPTTFNTTHRDIAWFKRMDQDHLLQMSPSFQRNLVWTVKQKSYLIDSILNGFPVPEIYMQDITNEDGTQTFIIVDGQQRITACLEFVNNGFPIDERDSPSYAGLFFDDLSTEFKKRVYSYPFLIRQLPEMSDAELREIFSRLNRNNVALNSQELRQATYWGEFITTMKEIAEDQIWQQLGIFTANDIKRMLDVEFISELAIAIIDGVQNKKSTIDNYYRLYEEYFPYKSQVKKSFNLISNELFWLFSNITTTRWGKKTDFYTLFVCLKEFEYLLPLNADRREDLNRALIDFGRAVDIALKYDRLEDAVPIDTVIYSYAAGVRASSDYGARRRRGDSLSQIIRSVLLND